MKRNLVDLHVCYAGIRELLEDVARPPIVRFVWLGQAGFAFRFGKCIILIDPYLSDFLAEKYRGKEFAHVRMMPPPIAHDKLFGVDLVLCTHRHSDHMDPVALPKIAANNPECRFVVPRAERESAERIGLPVERTITIDAEEEISLFCNVRIRAIPSAHETLKTNELGQHHFLGYILWLGETTIYHSGDCVPYTGLAQRLKRERIDLAMLPVNGRDEYRGSRGVPGNMAFDEAYALCAAADIPYLVPHHFGMFAFNTVASEELAANIAAKPPGVWVTVPEIKKIQFELRSCTF